MSLVQECGETSVKVQGESRLTLPREWSQSAELSLERPGPQPDLETRRETRSQISVSEWVNSKFFNQDQVSPGDTFVLTSADVDQCCGGFHEGQLSVADQASGLGGQIDRQHHEVRLSQQVVHVLTVSRPDCLLILNTPGQHGEKS